MTRRELLTGLVVAMVVLSAMPTSALAQDARRTVLLDQRATDVATVTVDGQQYEVYRYNNVLPWASGIDVYTGGERVTSEERAEEVLTALAQRRAADELGAEELEGLRATGQAARATASNVSAAAEAIDETLASVETDSGANGTADDDSSAAAGFNETAREALPELRALATASDAYAANATKLASMIERRSNGGDVDPRRLYAQYQATLDARSDVTDELGYGGVGQELSRLAEISEGAATTDGTDGTAPGFETVHERASAAADRTDELDGALSDLDLAAPRDLADSLEEEYMQQWRARRNAASEVYRSLGAAGLVVVGVVGYVGWRRR